MVWTSRIENSFVARERTGELVWVHSMLAMELWMRIPEVDSSPTLPIWRGRSGNIALVWIGVIAVACGWGLSEFAERIGVAPTCRNYATEQGWRYVSLVTYADSTTRKSGAICTFKDEKGIPEDVHLRDISFLTDLWVSLAVNMMITIPGIAIILAVLRTWLWKLRSST